LPALVFLLAAPSWTPSDFRFFALNFPPTGLVEADFGDEEVTLIVLCGEVQTTAGFPVELFSLKDIFSEGCFGDATGGEVTTPEEGLSFVLLTTPEDLDGVAVPVKAFRSRPTNEIQPLIN
jgi:hypothetical protein